MEWMQLILNVFLMTALMTLSYIVWDDAIKIHLNRTVEYHAGREAWLTFYMSIFVSLILLSLIISSFINL